MANEETNTSPAESEAVDSSMLGVDPTPVSADVQPSNPPAAPATTQQPAPTNSINLTPEQHQELLTAAQNYQTIVNDPTAHQLVYDHFNGETQEQTSAEPVVSPDGTVSNPEVTQLSQELAQLKQQYQQGLQSITAQQKELGLMRVHQFAQQNPDFEQHRTAIGNILQQAPQLGLEQALTLARAQANTAAPTSPAVDTSPSISTTETSTMGILPSGGNDTVMEEALRAINDRKATPSIDQAMDIAFRAARSKQE